jgi:hypothetical protein
MHICNLENLLDGAIVEQYFIRYRSMEFCHDMLLNDEPNFYVRIERIATENNSHRFMF